MSQFNLENELNSVIKMEGPISKGPQMRWQRKLNESSNLNKSRNESILNCSQNLSNGSGSKTPMKTLNMSIGNANNKTPGNTNKTPGKRGRPITPGKHTPGNRTPTSSGDRFIPNRSATQFEVGHYLIANQNNKLGDGADETMSPSKREFQQLMSENLNGDKLESKIISYKAKAPAAPEGYQNNLRVLYSSAKTPGTCKKTARHIPQVPERILDAPEIVDDYYLNLLDWSVNNHLAVCLGAHVYLWNAGSGDIQQLMELPNPDEYVGSVSWITEGNFLAIGTSGGEVQLWDVEKQKLLRNMRGHAARVGALSWNSYILSSGSRTGAIHHHDVRVADHQVATLAAHTQEVCGLRWSPDGRLLASGGNDNLLNIWETVQGQCYSNTSPLHTFNQHQAAVKALAWCPWQPSLLASGGGTADRHIRFWNCNTGSCLTSVDTKSQVCALLWSREHKELVSSHGFAHNQLILWKYPSMSKVAELTGHTQRVLHMAMSPDGSTVVSAAADETLRLWKCFAKDPAKNKAAAGKAGAAKAKASLLKQSIR